MDAYLSQIKETCLPHDLNRVVTQILVIFARDDRRKLLKGILRIFAKKDGAFFVDGALTHHQALTFPMDGRRRQLCLGRSNHNRPYHHLRFLRWTIGLVQRFPLCGRVGQTRSLLLPRSRLLLDVSPPPSVLHFCIKRTKRSQVKLL